MFGNSRPVCDDSPGEDPLGRQIEFEWSGDQGFSETASASIAVE